jgi:hypothetical protein
VRDETGASHADCRRVLELTKGDPGAAVALWFAERSNARATPAHSPGGPAAPIKDTAKGDKNA